MAAISSVIAMLIVVVSCSSSTTSRTATSDWILDLIQPTNHFAQAQRVEYAVQRCMADRGFHYSVIDFSKATTVADDLAFRTRWGYGYTTGAPARPDLDQASGERPNDKEGMTSAQQVSFDQANQACLDQAEADETSTARQQFARLPTELQELIRRYATGDSADVERAITDWQQCMQSTPAARAHGWHQPNEVAAYYSGRATAGANDPATQAEERAVAVADFTCQSTTVARVRQQLLASIMAYVADHHVDDPRSTAA